MENKAHALAAGTFVLLVTALLVALAAWLTREVGAQRVFEMTTRDAVSGLQLQAAVRFRGVSVGKVTAIEFDPHVRGNVLVRIAVDDSAPVTRSTYATLGFQGVTGLAFVALDDSGESKEALVAPEDGVAQIPLRPGLLARLSDQGATLLVQLEETSRRVNQLLAPENQKVLIGSIASVSRSADSVASMSTNMDTLLNTQLGPEKVNIPKFVEDTAQTVRALQGTAQAISASVVEVGKTAGALTELSQRMGRAGGPLDKLSDGAEALASASQTLNANTLPRLGRTADEAARSARQIGRTVNSVGENPQSLIYGTGPIGPGPGEPGFALPGAKP